MQVWYYQDRETKLRRPHIRIAWPKTIPEQARAVRQALTLQVGAVTSKSLAKKFSRANVDRVEELLQTLMSLGQARETERGYYVA